MIAAHCPESHQGSQHEREGEMLARFNYLREDSKYLIVASIVCALIIATIVISLPNCAHSESGYWAQMIGNIR